MKRMLSALVVVSALISACKKDKTPPTAPIITTSALTNITTTSATAGGTITSDGGSAITKSGVVWSKTNSTPTTSDSVVNGTATSGSFTINLANLDFNTKYYVRAFAINSVGTSYGDAVTLNTTNDTSKVRFTYMGQTVIYGVIVSSVTSRKWMDRNLGANQAATAYNDSLAFGDLFQWGRLADGHQLRNSDTTGLQSSIDVPGHNKFIRSKGAANGDWRNPQNPNLWQGSSGTNNPCPTGWHVPTQSEWAAETGITNYNTAFSQLKLTASGFRWLDTKFYSIGTNGYYWTSTPDSSPAGINSYNLNFSASSANAAASVTARGQGFAIRCIKD